MVAVVVVVGAVVVGIPLMVAMEVPFVVVGEVVVDVVEVVVAVIVVDVVVVVVVGVSSVEAALVDLVVLGKVELAVSLLGEDLDAPLLVLVGLVGLVGLVVKQDSYIWGQWRLCSVSKRDTDSPDGVTTPTTEEQDNEADVDGAGDNDAGVCVTVCEEDEDGVV